MELWWLHIINMADKSNLDLDKSLWSRLLDSWENMNIETESQGFKT